MILQFVALITKSIMHISLVPETLFHIGPLAVTNSLFTSWLAVLVIVLIAVAFSAGLRKIPGRFQNLIEFVVESLLNFMETVAGDRERAKKFFAIVATIFIYILVANWMGILPGVGSIGFTEVSHGEETFVPLLRSVHSDLNMTLSLGIFVVLLSHIFGFMTSGIRHLGNFFTLRDFGSSFSGILEIVGEISKIVSLGFRLFGNIFAGEVLLAIIGMLLPYVVPLPFLGLEIFVGFIQALIFATLAMTSFATWTRPAH
ncbi:MAG: F0F1 ATP synthase subunit A [bacterium]|nr:F0F1 ATP synthase subunit A [bacterium]